MTFPTLTVALLCLSTEHGEFLALDLGGTNFRVLRVRVTDNGLQRVEMENQIYAIPEDIMRGSGTQVSLAVVAIVLTMLVGHPASSCTTEGQSLGHPGHCSSCKVSHGGSPDYSCHILFPEDIWQ